MDPKVTSQIDHDTVNAIIAEMQREREARSRRWRVLFLGMPALVIGLVGVVFAILAGAIGLVKLVPDALATACQRIALWMVGADPADTPETLPNGRNARPDASTKPMAPSAPPKRP